MIIRKRRDLLEMVLKFFYWIFQTNRVENSFVFCIVLGCQRNFWQEKIFMENQLHFSVKNWALQELKAP